jgi:hypothetical protein
MFPATRHWKLTFSSWSIVAARSQTKRGVLAEREGLIPYSRLGPNSSTLSRNTATPLVLTPVQWRRRRQGPSAVTASAVIFLAPVNAPSSRQRRRSRRRPRLASAEAMPPLPVVGPGRCDDGVGSGNLMPDLGGGALASPAPVCAAAAGATGGGRCLACRPGRRRRRCSLAHLLACSLASLLTC